MSLYRRKARQGRNWVDIHHYRLLITPFDLSLLAFFLCINTNAEWTLCRGTTHPSRRNTTFSCDWQSCSVFRAPYHLTNQYDHLVAKLSRPPPPMALHSARSNNCREDTGLRWWVRGEHYSLWPKCCSSSGIVPSTFGEQPFPFVNLPQFCRARLDRPTTISET